MKMRLSGQYQPEGAAKVAWQRAYWDTAYQLSHAKRKYTWNKFAKKEYLSKMPHPYTLWLTDTGS